MASREPGREKPVTEDTVSKNSTDSTADIAKTAFSMNTANKSQMSQALIIQAYANSVAQQPWVEFEGEHSLATFEKSINDGLKRAKQHATQYLEVIQPLLIKNMSNIGNYYASHNTVVTTMPPGVSEAEWIDVLHSLQAEAAEYQKEARRTVDVLSTLHSNLVTDVSSFATIVNELNEAVNGDKGVLDNIIGELGILQGEIDEAIAAVAISALSIIGGIFMIFVGAIAGLITAGTSGSLVLGGISFLVGGIAGEVGSAISLANLSNTKFTLLSEEFHLKAEVKLAGGLQSGYASLFKQVQNAVSASLTMENAWKSLSADLGTMITDLQNGIMSSGQIRQLFFTDANDSVRTVIEDINIIKVHMAGLTEIVAKKGQSVGETSVAWAKAHQESKVLVFLAEKEPMEGAVADSTSITANVAKEINTANKKQCAQALIIQAYANSVNEQSMVDFSGLKQLANYQKQINSGLDTAQIHANNYLNVIQPTIIANIANISNYYALHNAVATTLPEGSTEKQWIEALTALENQAKAYQTNANGVLNLLRTLNKSLTTDAENFATVVTKLNGAVNGDNGVLTTITDELSTIQSQIDGAIAGVALSGLTILGGGIMVFVGLVAEIPTGGISSLLVLGGIGVIALGIAGEVASSISLENLNDEKAGLITKEANLTEEVKLAAALLSGYHSLSFQVRRAITASTSMSNAWHSLSDDLGSLIKDLNSGIKASDYMRKLFTTTAAAVVKTVIEDVRIIKTQMAGVENVVAKKGQTVGEAIVAAVEKKQALPTGVTMLLSDSKRFHSVTAPGSLPQSILNLNAIEHQIRSVAGLPSAVQKIQKQTLTDIPAVITLVHKLQGSVSNFVISAIPQLNDIEKMLKSNQSLENIVKVMKSLCAEASDSSTIATKVSKNIHDKTATTNDYIHQLASIDVTLTTQQAVLKVILTSAKNEEVAAEKKKIFYSLLSFLGLPGTIASEILLSKTRSEVERYQREIINLASQFASSTSMNVNTTKLEKEFENLITKLSSVNNSFTIISQDIFKIESDVGARDILKICEIFVKAAITEVKELSIDALGSVVSI